MVFLLAPCIQSSQNINIDMIFHVKTKDISVMMPDPKLWYDIQWSSVTFEQDPHLNNVGIPKHSMLGAKKACLMHQKREAMGVCYDFSVLGFFFFFNHLGKVF